MERHRYEPHHPEYPVRLGRLESPPGITATGPIPNVRAVAIVGSRQPMSESEDFARSLATELARAGVTIVSGGAFGIDAVAHRAALDAGGATWVVLPCASRRLVPQENAGLFERVAAAPGGRIVWPFTDDAAPHPKKDPLARNRVLVALAEHVVVIQAKLVSGSRNAATEARRLNRPVWMPAAMPSGRWQFAMAGTFESLRTGGASLLTSEGQLLEALGLPPPEPIRAVRKRPSSLPLKGVVEPIPDASWSEAEKAMIKQVSVGPCHQDDLAHKAGLPISSAVTALLTLSMKDVVVEGPAGFYRRKSET